MPINAATSAFLVARQSSLQVSAANTGGVSRQILDELFYIGSLLGELGGGGGGGGASADFEAIAEFRATADNPTVGYSSGDILVRIRNVSATAAVTYSWINAETGADLVGVPPVGERESLGGGASISLAEIGPNQSILTTRRITLPEFDVSTPANTANPIITGLNVATTSVIVIWRPDNSYFDNARSSAEAASVVLDSVCWSIGENPVLDTSFVWNQGATSGAILSRANALAVRAGSHIQPGGAAVEVWLIELDGPVTENLRLLPSTVDTAGLVSSTAVQQDLSTGNAIQSVIGADNAISTVTIPAPGAGSSNRLYDIFFGYSGTTAPTNATIAVTATGIGTITVPITSPGAGFLPTPITYPVNQPVTITMPAGGAGTQGYINAIYRVVSAIAAVSITVSVGNVFASGSGNQVIAAGTGSQVIGLT